MPKRARFAIYVFGRRVTAWNENRDAVIEEALQRGHATRDDEPRAPVFWSVGAALVERKE